mgnify:CR=1 FL=1
MTIAQSGDDVTGSIAFGSPYLMPLTIVDGVITAAGQVVGSGIALLVVVPGVSTPLTVRGTATGMADGASLSLSLELDSATSGSTRSIPNQMYCVTGTVGATR